MKERPIVVLDRIQLAVVFDRIRLTVVLDRIRTAVSVKRIPREREANDAAGKSEWHRFDDRHHRGKRPMLFFLADVDELGSRDGVEMVDGLGERRMTEGLSA